MAKLTRFLLTASALSFPMQAALAQDAGTSVRSTLDAGDDATAPIIVTAQRRAESIQDVPISITAFSQEAIAERQLTNPADITSLSPGTFVTAARGDQNPVFAIRGLSLNDTFSNNNPTVGVYVDEVVQPFTPMLSFQLFDIDRIEVLKGPQGTLYGRNTTGGAINFITAKPTFDTNGYVKASYERFDRYEFEVAAGGPASDTLAGRIAVKTVQQFDGWQTNALTGEKTGNKNRIIARGQLLWEPSDDFQVLAKAGYAYDKSKQQLREHIGYYAAPFGGPYCDAALEGRRDETTCVDFLGYSDPTPERRTVEASAVYGTESISRAYDFTLNAEYDLGSVVATSITSYSDFSRKAGDDSDGAALIELDTLFTDKIQSFTQELRLNSDDSGPLTWVAGLYYQWDEIYGSALQALDDHIFHTRADTSYTQKTDSYAGFGQASYEVIDGLTLTAGLRYTKEDKRFAYDSIDLNPFGNSTLPTPVAGVDNRLKEDNFSGKLGIEFKPSNDLLLYASASKGFKSGGFKAAIAFNPDEVLPFKGETVYAYEVGLKSQLLDGRLTLNAAGYYNDWRDFQAMVTEIRSGINVIVLSNAGDARIYGGEVDIAYRPTDTINLRLAANAMDTKITKFNNAPGAPDFTGNKLANAPEYSVTGSFRWQAPALGGGWRPYVLTDASYRSKVYYSLANRGQNSQDGFWLVNARLGVESPDGNWEAAVYGKNIFNKLYVSASYDNFGGIFPSQDFLGDPVTYGVSITHKF